jgi:hypothetical protein
LEFIAMQFPPGSDERKCPSRELSFQHSQPLDGDDRFVIAVDRMEVRDTVIPVIHVDHDSVKLCDLWQFASPDHVVICACTGLSVAERSW